MEQLLQKQSITVTKAVLDATENYVLSGDFILPEYCPDVAVVLKCLVTPYIHSRRFSGDTLTLDGMAVVRVLYLDEERRHVREAEFTQPINCSMRGQDGCEGALPQVRVTPDYVNCRAVSPRRIEVRGGFTLHATAYGSEQISLPTQAARERLHTRHVEKTVTAPLVEGEKVITVNETLGFDSSLPPAEQLLGGDCKAVVNDCKFLNDKAIVKGQIFVHQLYTDDGARGTTYVLEDSVPFSLIMDLVGVRDGHCHTVDVSVLSDTQECVAGTNGQNTAMELTVKLLVQVRVYESATARLLLDAYHTDCPVTLDKQPLTIHSLVGAYRHTTTAQKSVDLPDTGLAEIIDLWVQPQSAVGGIENGHVTVCAPMLVSILVRDTQGQVAYFERTQDVCVDCSQVIPTLPFGEDVALQAELAVCGVTYASLGDKLELRLTVCASVSLWETVSNDVVSDITLHQDEAYPSERAALRLYYADPGECVWDIARRCHTSPIEICEENDLHDETLTAKTVLLIPAE